MNVLLVPEVPKTLILGMDFWKTFNIKPVVLEEVEVKKTIKTTDEHALDENEAVKLQNILKIMPPSKEGA